MDNWYKMIKPKLLQVCSNCGLVYGDPSGLAGGLTHLDKGALALIESKYPNILTHGICMKCCVELYGEDICKDIDKD